MPAISAGDNFKCNLLDANKKKFRFEFTDFFPRSPFNNKPTLVQVMASRRTGDRPLPELILTQFTDAYMRHQGRWVNMICEELWKQSALIRQSFFTLAPGAERG